MRVFIELWACLAKPVPAFLPHFILLLYLRVILNFLYIFCMLYGRNYMLQWRSEFEILEGLRTATKLHSDPINFDVITWFWFIWFSCLLQFRSGRLKGIFWQIENSTGGDKLKTDKSTKLVEQWGVISVQEEAANTLIQQNAPAILTAEDRN